MCLLHNFRALNVRCNKSKTVGFTHEHIKTIRYTPLLPPVITGRIFKFVFGRKDTWGPRVRRTVAVAKFEIWNSNWPLLAPPSCLPNRTCGNKQNSASAFRKRQKHARDCAIRKQQHKYHKRARRYVQKHTRLLFSC